MIILTVKVKISLVEHIGVSILWQCICTTYIIIALQLHNTQTEDFLFLFDILQLSIIIKLYAVPLIYYHNHFVDINECVEALMSNQEICNMTQVCENRAGSFQCSCPDGTELNIQGMCLALPISTISIPTTTTSATYFLPHTSASSMFSVLLPSSTIDQISSTPVVSATYVCLNYDPSCSLHIHTVHIHGSTSLACTVVACLKS